MKNTLVRVVFTISLIVGFANGPSLPSGPANPDGTFPAPPICPPDTTCP